MERIRWRGLGTCDSKARPDDRGVLLPPPRGPIHRNLAGGRGFVFGATIEELEKLARAVCLQGLSFEVVRDWFHARLHRL
jgi:hypothetical protein